MIGEFAFNCSCGYVDRWDSESASKEDLWQCTTALVLWPLSIMWLVIATNCPRATWHSSRLIKRYMLPLTRKEDGVRSVKARKLDQTTSGDSPIILVVNYKNAFNGPHCTAMAFTSQDVSSNTIQAVVSCWCEALGWGLGTRAWPSFRICFTF